MSFRLRSFVQVECKPPSNIEAKGVYNFFTPDEKVSEDTALRYQGAFSDLGTSQGQNKIVFKTLEGREVSENNLPGVVPRYIVLNFRTPENTTLSTSRDYDLQESRNEGIFYTSEEIQSPHDTSLRITDLTITNRILEKLDYAFLRDNTNPSPLEGVYAEENLIGGSLLGWGSDLPGTVPVKGNGEKLSEDFKKIVMSLVNVNMASEIEDVNETSSIVNLSETVQRSRTSSLFGKCDRRLIIDMFESSVDRRWLSSEILSSLQQDDNYLDPLNGGEIFDLELEINADTVLLPQNAPDVSKVELAGYMIERYETGETIIDSEPERTFFINVPNVQTFLDVRVKYGVTYTYSIRAVYRITHRTVINGQKRELVAFITSEPSDPVEARVIETTPPNEPDGVMYDFNFSERRGLKISWQYPTGIQRDTKYFQIFRRKNITEPFTCIGMIDFDNSVIRSVPRETIRPDKIFKYNGAVTYFEDPDFLKDSSYIYAVAAVDAHGYTSGYSVQTRVSFRKTENRLELKRISRQGAPKQYPNFFVDPDEDENTFVNSITQDSIKTSGFNRLRVYFDPDGMTYSNVANPDTDDKIPIFYTNRPSFAPSGNQNPDNGVYKLTFINVDRQKAKTLEISIDDARGTGFFPAQ